MWNLIVKTAVITGITGQDGPYLAKLLLENGYRVYGTYRRSSILNFWRLEYLGVLGHERLHLVGHDLIDPGGAIRLLDKCQPEEVYNLGAQTFVGSSFDQPTQTAEITGLGPVHMLEAIRTVNRDIRFYQASSAEMFGKVQATPQNEQTPFYPRSPYGVSKLFAHWMTINYRESYGIFAGIGILFNHESPLRGEEFVTRKITTTVAAIARGAPVELTLGNLDARRDWGYAGDYVRAIWAILQAKEPDTFVIATAKTASVRDFASLAFELAGMPLEWMGSGEEERGCCRKTGRVLVRVDPALRRPAEVDILLGDATKAERILGWRHTTSMHELCSIMLGADVERERRAHRQRQDIISEQSDAGLLGGCLV
ncbi:GDP-mannose 4,6-dehydratase [Ancylobacter sp. Lp-2]|nr:GDP-mannose 4,6-dehydratase [Ancylobacter sp. Lp-2]MCB4769065.1 GDP-mannose 4,6-dehydratase [Ancylobacter sp. Lp-2]